VKTTTKIIFTVSAILLLIALGYLMLWLFGKGMDLSWEAFSTFIVILSTAGGISLPAIFGSKKLNKIWLVFICIVVVALVLVIEIGLMTLYGVGFHNF
jgi:peptidoglycan/LPS O-acetylase OafA/YrhL